MAFVTIKTDFKTLKFGDNPNVSPYIVTNPPPLSISDETINTSNFFTNPNLINVGVSNPGIELFTSIITANQNNTDYPIRGGGSYFIPGISNVTLSGIADRRRISKFFKDNPKGPTFIEKQVGLQLSNPKIETSGGSIFGTTNVPGPIENTRVYNNGINTLAQVEVSGTGAHAVRHGMVPFGAFQKNYYLTVNQQNVLGNADGTLRNRLALLYASKMSPPENSNFANPINLNIDINRVNSLGISLNRNLLFQYLGGPGSSYGIGSTTIRRVVDTSDLGLQNPIVPDEYRNNYIKYGRFNTIGEPLPSQIDQPPLQNRLGLLFRSKIVNSSENPIAISSGSLFWGISSNPNFILDYANGPGTSTKGPDGSRTLDKNTFVKRAVDTTRLKSSRTMVYSELASQNINDSVYKSIKEPGLTTAGRFRDIQDFRVELDQTGWSFTNSVDYRFYLGTSYIDKINSLKPFVFTNNKNPWDIDSENTQDLIKFVFEAISNDDTTKSTAIFFRAFLNGTITDNNTATWNSFKYQGRGENFYTYQGFDRSIGFSFRVYASSPIEIDAMYSRLNALLSQVYPDYTKDQGIMRGGLIRLTIGDYVRRMPGFLESVNLSVEPNNGWEIEKDFQIPHVVDVQVSFKPILEELPRRADGTQIPEIIYNKTVPQNNTKTTNKPDPIPQPAPQPNPIPQPSPNPKDPDPKKTSGILPGITDDSPVIKNKKRTPKVMLKLESGGGGSSGGGGATGGW